jgi:hypothetical protein
MNLVLRPARPEDQARVFEITANTWEGGDYIPHVWDRWLADPKGELTVAELDGVVAALGKLSWMGDGQWWIEGLRVDPQQRLKGIGQAINTYQLDLVKKLGGRVVRYATGLRNEGSHRIAARAGFHALTRFVERSAGPLDGPSEAQVLTGDDLDTAWNLARGSDLLEMAQGMYVFDWRVVPLSREGVAECIRQGVALGVRADGDLTAWCLAKQEPDWEGVEVTTWMGTDEGLERLARAMRAQAGAWGKQVVEAMATPHPRLLQILDEAGYQLEWQPKEPARVREQGIDIFELVMTNA